MSTTGEVLQRPQRSAKGSHAGGPPSSRRRKGRDATMLSIACILVALLLFQCMLLNQAHGSEGTAKTHVSAASNKLESFRQGKNTLESKVEGGRPDSELTRLGKDILEIPKSDTIVNRMVSETSFHDVDDQAEGARGGSASQINKKNARKATTTKVRDPLLEPSTRSKKVTLKRDVEYLGVMLDAGRHYFPIPWIYQLLDHLELLGFNMLHFRLTDDQAFNVRLDSHPELAQAAEGSGGKVYSTDELRKMVAYASSKNIIVMAEVNVPGHAGGWAGSIPRLVVPCANFICSRGYGLALNASHPQLMPLIKDVLGEIKDIFTTSPFLHLGGDELEMSRDCFTEVGETTINFNKFEEDLGTVLRELGIDEDNVVRWEMTGQDTEEEVKTRIKGIDHYWYSRSYQDLPQDTAIVPSVPRLFCSHGLYFDSNQQEDAWTIYKYTKGLLLHDTKPIAIIAGAFELSVGYWLDRNIVGRLLAVGIGASPENYSAEEAFLSRYQELCTLLDLPEQICDKAGAPMIPEEEYKEDWVKTTAKWRENLCDRLAIKETIRSLLTSPLRTYYIIARESNNIFWNNLHQISRSGSLNTSTANTTIRSDFERPSILEGHTVEHTGIILDLVEDGHYAHDKLLRMIAIIDYISQLGFNTLQLRLMTDYGFAVKLDSHEKLAFGAKTSSFRPYEIRAIKKVIDYAATVGIRVIPEITVAHRAGGWFNAATMVNCPQHHCESNKGLTLDMRSGGIFPTLSSVLRELRNVFTSPFLHLGHDERHEGEACLKEAKLEPDFDKFEGKITKLLEYDDVPLDKVLRWENEEQEIYKNRAGTITHYHRGLPEGNFSNDDIFISTGLHLNDPSTTLFTAWDLYQHVQKLIKFKPKGLMASLVTFDDLNLRNLNVRQRLLAIAMSLSNAGMSETAFQKLFTKLCTSANNKGCEIFGKLRDGDAAAVTMHEQLVKKQENICLARLQYIPEVRPREGILVENGTDT